MPSGGRWRSGYLTARSCARRVGQAVQRGFVGQRHSQPLLAALVLLHAFGQAVAQLRGDRG